MTPAQRAPFAAELALAGSDLPPACQHGFSRLAKLIQARPGKFQFIVLDCRDELLRDQLIEALNGFLAAAGRRTARVRLTARDHADFATVEQELMSCAATSAAIHVTGGPAWFTAAKWSGFNIRREAIAREVKASLIFWLNPDAIAAMARIAIDLWAWRTAVIHFTRKPQPMSLPQPDVRVVDDRARAEREARIGFLGASLLAPDLSGDLRFGLALELGDLLASLGRIHEAEIAYYEAARSAAGDRPRTIVAGRLADMLQARGELDEALRIRREVEVPVFDRLGDVHERAVTMSKIADVLLTRGEVETALRILREEALPVFDRLGDVRSRAAILGQIAGILQARGEVDEALRIRREEQLPVYERIGDTRSRAVTMGQIADILQARGEFDEALRIRREEQLPVFDRLGDVRSYAVTMGRIADILQARGEFDAALRIRREDELPVYDRLGDVREHAVTMGKIADILQIRGEVDEALRIRREEQLPVFDRLGDVHSHAATMGNIADILQAQGKFDDSLRIRAEEQLPVFARLGDIRSRAVTMGKIADILQTRGEFDEALRIRREEELPVFDRLGDVHSRAVTMGKIADILQRRGEFDEALRIRREEELPVFDRLGDVRERAVTLHNIAVTLINAGGSADNRTDEIGTSLSEAFAISLDRKLADGIAHTGALLGRYRAANGHQKEALSILDAATMALTRLSAAEGLALVEEARGDITESKE